MKRLLNMFLNSQFAVVATTFTLLFGILWLFFTWLTWDWAEYRVEVAKQKVIENQRTYDAWSKHTGNPNGLTFEEWEYLNKNYVPVGKYPKKVPQTY